MFHISGHILGSISILDKEDDILFIDDNVCDSIEYIIQQKGEK